MYKIHPENSRQLTDQKIIYDYIHGGRGVVKLQAPLGGSHTYFFKKPAEKYAFPDDVLFVYAIHDEKQLFYLGMVEKDKFRTTRNSRFLPDSDIVKGAVYIMKMATTPNFKTPMKLFHMGVCARCGSKLCAEKSLVTGIGPKCRKKIDDETTR